jgi:Domain of unknown function (DUF5069)
MSKCGPQRAAKRVPSYQQSRYRCYRPLAYVLVRMIVEPQEVDRWVRENATQKDPKALIKWNNEMRGLRLCDLSEQAQEYLETYIPQFCHPPSKVKFFFDVYDVEEGVL